jgi:hypothetical protein
MSNATRRVLELFLHPPRPGVTDVTGVTTPFVTPKNPMVTLITPVTYQKQVSPVEGVTGINAAPRKRAETLAFEARIIEWLDRNPAPSPTGRCAWCGQLESDSASIVPFGTEPGPMRGSTANAGSPGRTPDALRRSRPSAGLKFSWIRHRASEHKHGARRTHC